MSTEYATLGDAKSIAVEGPIKQIENNIRSVNSGNFETIQALEGILARLEGPHPEEVSDDKPEGPDNLLGAIKDAQSICTMQSEKIARLVLKLDEIIR